jgi:hypothetical protein
MATTHLGSLGTVREPVDADFDYFGETIRIHPDATDLHFAELMMKAQSIDLGNIDLEDPESWTPEQVQAMAQANDAAAETIREQIHPDDWDRFFKTAKANRQQTLDLMALSQQLTEAVAGGFPTTRSSASSPGRTNTKRRSAGTSSSRVPARRRRGGTPPAAADAKRALTLLQGRADLQEFVVMGQEAAAEAKAG